MRISRRAAVTAVSTWCLAVSTLAFAGAPGQARQRHPSSSGRASSPATSGAGQRAVPRAQAPRNAAPAPQPQAAPAPREQAPATRQRYPDDRAIGRAVPRTEPIRPSHSYRVYAPGYYYYYPYAFTGLGLGYYYYDPLWRGYYSPYGYGDGYGYGYDNGYSYTPSYDEDQDNAAIHLKVKPRDASVFVDGYYTGTVDDYDGIFQKLHLQSGPHRIEVRKPGYASLSFDVDLQPGQTITYKGELQRR